MKARRKSIEMLFCRNSESQRRTFRIFTSAVAIEECRSAARAVHIDRLAGCSRVYAPGTRREEFERFNDKLPASSVGRFTDRSGSAKAFCQSLQNVGACTVDENGLVWVG